MPYTWDELSQFYAYSLRVRNMEAYWNSSTPFKARVAEMTATTPHTCGLSSSRGSAPHQEHSEENLAQKSQERVGIRPAGIPSSC